MQVKLVPGGRDRPVTSGNVVEYIHRVADYRLNQQVPSMCMAQALLLPAASTLMQHESSSTETDADRLLCRSGQPARRFCEGFMT